MEDALMRDKEFLMQHENNCSYNQVVWWTTLHELAEGKDVETDHEQVRMGQI